MEWSLVGLAGGLALALAAWWCSRSPGGFYDREFYGMSARTHRTYSVVGLLFAAYFTVTSALRLDSAGVAGLALYAVIAVFYGTSFLRGAADPDE